MKHQGKVVQVEKVWVGGKTFELKLRLVDAGRSHSKRFSYSVTHSDPDLVVRGNDPEQCLRDAEVELRAKLAVDWIPSIVIYVESDDNCTYYGSGETLFKGRLSLRYALVDVAKRADGTDVWREPVREGFIKRGREFHEHDGLPDGTVIADTPENREKLQVISDGLTKLSANLTLLLNQDRIVKTLQDVRVLALPAPVPGKRRVTRKKA